MSCTMLKFLNRLFQVLRYVASLLEMPEEEVAELSYRNTMQLFSYPGSKVCGEG